MTLLKITDEGPIELKPGDVLVPGDTWILLQREGDDQEAIDAVLRELNSN